jgi:hypothetical protein
MAPPPPDSIASTRTRPERVDHWLPVAGTFAFLPDGPSPGRRLEVPELGNAVSFPCDWLVEPTDGGITARSPAIVRPEELGPEVAMDTVFHASAPHADDEDVVEACALLLQLASRHQDRDTADVVEDPLDSVWGNPGS